MNIFDLSYLANLAVVWNRVVVYNREGLMDKMWTGVEVAILGMKEELTVLVGIMRGVGSLVMHQIESKNCNCNLLVH